MHVASVIAGLYLVATFTATGLAKLRRQQGTKAGILTEGVISPRLVPIVVVGLPLVELTLASLVAVGVDPLAVGVSIASLFTAFCIYRMASAVRTGRISCNC